MKTHSAPMYPLVRRPARSARWLLSFALSAAVLASACGASDDRDAPVGTATEAVNPAGTDGWFDIPSQWVVQSGQAAATAWSYSTSQPPSSWKLASFNANAWPKLNAGIAGAGQPAYEQDTIRSTWPASSSKLWLRRTFTISQTNVSRVILWGRWDDSIKVYINGVLAAERPEYTPNYLYLGISAAARAALSSSGTNVIAVEVEDTGGDRYFDLGLAVTTKLNDRPVSGVASTSTLSALFDPLIKAALVDEGVPAATVSMMKDDTLAYSKGFGWKDKGFVNQLPRDAVMRLASVDKMLTMMMMAKLVRDEFVDTTTGDPITYDTPVFPLLSRHVPRIAATPAGDDLIDQVTIGHLVHHVGGVRDVDLGTFYDVVGKAPGTTDPTDNVVWIKQAGVMHTPGICPDECYSNSGYDMLRYVMQTLTGNLIGTMRSQLLAPAGTSDVFIAHEPLALRSSREPWYQTFEHPWDRSVFLENVFGLASTADALVRAQRIYHNGDGSLLHDPVTGAYEPADNGGGGPNGGFSGTATKTVQRRWDRISYAILFNTGAGDVQRLGEKIECVASSLSDSEWGVGPLNLKAWMGFEDAGFWFSPSGTPFGQTASTVSQGTHALSLPGGYVQVRSADFDGCEFRAPTSTLALDVYVPTAQPNPYWLGQVSAFLTCEDANIHNKYLGEKPLTGLARGKYHTLTFAMDQQARAQFAKPNRCRFDFALNTNAGSGTWHLDKLRFQ